MKKFRLYSPLKVKLEVYDNDKVVLHDDSKFYKLINEILPKFDTNAKGEIVKRGIMEFYKFDDINWQPHVDDKVASAFIRTTVLSINGEEKLFGICDIELKEELTKSEMNYLYEYVESEHFEGFGDEVEKKKIKIKVEDGEEFIFLYFWNKDNFYLKTEKEIKAEGYTDLYPPKWKSEKVKKINNCR